MYCKSLAVNSLLIDDDGLLKIISKGTLMRRSGCGSQRLHMLVILSLGLAEGHMVLNLPFDTSQHKRTSESLGGIETGGV